MAGINPYKEEEQHRQSAPKGTRQWAEEQQTDDGQQSAPKGTMQWTEQANNGSNGKQAQSGGNPNVKYNSRAVRAKTKTEPLVSKDEQEQRNAVMGLDQQIGTVKKLIEDYTPETEEERKKRERKEKRDKIIAAISDGVAAIGNLVTTSMGGISSYDPKTGSQTEAQNDRVAQLRKLRDARQEKWDMLQFQLGKLYDQRESRRREVAAQQAEAKRKEKEERRNDESHKWTEKLAELGYKKAEAEAEEARHKANISGVNAANAQKMQKAKIAAEQSKANANYARAGKYKADANGGGKAEGEFTAYDRQGQPHRFRSKAAADLFAQQNGTYQTVEKADTTVVTKQDITGTSTTTEVEKRSAGGYARKPDGSTSKGVMPGASNGRSTSKGDMPGASKRK